jgi:hypothetical protein
MIFGSLIFVLFGIFYLVFAYREPSNAVEHWFRVPAIFVFFPEHSRVRLGRITTGAVLVTMGLGGVVQDLYHRILG